MILSNKKYYKNPFLFLRQRLEGFTEIVVDVGKLSDAHHAENFFEMLRKSRDSDLLVVFSGLSKNLN